MKVQNQGQKPNQTAQKEMGSIKVVSPKKLSQGLKSGNILPLDKVRVKVGRDTFTGPAQGAQYWAAHRSPSQAMKSLTRFLSDIKPLLNKLAQSESKIEELTDNQKSPKQVGKESKDIKRGHRKDIKLGGMSREKIEINLNEILNGDKIVY